jgi:hypothetical protein
MPKDEQSTNPADMNPDQLLEAIRRDIGRNGVDSSPLAALVDALDEKLYQGADLPREWELKGGRGGA